MNKPDKIAACQEDFWEVVVQVWYPAPGSRPEPYREPEQAGALAGALVEIITRQVLAFFDPHLRHHEAPRLDEPAPDYPEVQLRRRNVGGRTRAWQDSEKHPHSKRFRWQTRAVLDDKPHRL